MVEWEFTGNLEILRVGQSSGNQRLLFESHSHEVVSAVAQGLTSAWTHIANQLCRGSCFFFLASVILPFFHRFRHLSFPHLDQFHHLSWLKGKSREPSSSTLTRGLFGRGLSDTRRRCSATPRSASRRRCWRPRCRMERTGGGRGVGFLQKTAETCPVCVCVWVCVFVLLVLAEKWLLFSG